MKIKDLVCDVRNNGFLSPENLEIARDVFISTDLNKICDAIEDDTEEVYFIMSKVLPMSSFLLIARYHVNRMLCEREDTEQFLRDVCNANLRAARGETPDD